MLAQRGRQQRVARSRDGLAVKLPMSWLTYGSPMLPPRLYELASKASIDHVAQFVAREVESA